MTPPLHAQLAGLIAEREAAILGADEMKYVNAARAVDDFMWANEKAILAALQPPEGWVMVPVKPTHKMTAAGFAVVDAEHDPEAVYTAMLKAAPPR